MAAKKRAKKKSAKKKTAKKKTAKRKPARARRTTTHSIKVKYGKPSPRELPKPGDPRVHHKHKVKFSKVEKAARFAVFADSPFKVGGGPDTIPIPSTQVVEFDPSPQTNPPTQYSFHYDVTDEDGNILSSSDAAPNPPDIVVE